MGHKGAPLHGLQSLFATLLGQAKEALRGGTAGPKGPGSPEGEALRRHSNGAASAHYIATRHREFAPGRIHGEGAFPQARGKQAILDRSGPDLGQGASEIGALKAEKDSRRGIEARDLRIPKGGSKTAHAGDGEAAEDIDGARRGQSRKKPSSRTEGNESIAFTDGGRAFPAMAKSEDRAVRSSSKDEAGEAKKVESPRERQGPFPETALAGKIQVSDLRKAQAKREKQAETEPLAAKFEEKGGSKEILIDLGRTTQSRSAERPAETIAPETRAPGNDFASQLAERLRESGNTDIVQSARIILKDGDAGTIRMRLNPPELGNVKIELKLADNSISGKIVVESDVAKTAFEKGLADLQDAFRSGGFESAQLEVSVGSGNAGQDRPGQASDDKRPFWSERRRGIAFDASVPGIPAFQQRGDRAVDMFA